MSELLDSSRNIKGSSREGFLAEHLALVNICWPFWGHRYFAHRSLYTHTCISIFVPAVRGGCPCTGCRSEPTPGGQWQPHGAAGGGVGMGRKEVRAGSAAFASHRAPAALSRGRALAHFAPSGVLKSCDIWGGLGIDLMKKGFAGDLPQCRQVGSGAGVSEGRPRRVLGWIWPPEEKEGLSLISALQGREGQRAQTGHRAHQSWGRWQWEQRWTSSCPNRGSVLPRTQRTAVAVTAHSTAGTAGGLFSCHLQYLSKQNSVLRLDTFKKGLLWTEWDKTMNCSRTDRFSIPWPVTQLSPFPLTCYGTELSSSACENSAFKL